MSERAAKRANYLDLFDRLNDPILIINQNYQVIDVNPQAETFLGINPNELQNFNINMFFSSEEKMMQKIRQTIRRYHPIIFTTTIELQGQVKHLLIETCCLDLSEGSTEDKVIQFLIKDQTELVEAKKSLEQKNQELAAANELLAKISITDKLTDLFNRRYFDESLAKEFERSKRTELPLSLIIFDVDKFKHYNDTNGHGPGDELLTELAVVIKNSVRNSDIPCRYGGEEFVVLCPDTNAQDALVVAERIRLAVMNHNFKFKENQPLGFISVSIGISCFPDSSTSPESLCANADHALYQSKENGRNRTTIFK